MNVKDFNGIVLYDIELDGCLNGVYTNMKAPAGVIFNEIARKIIPSGKTSDNAGIEESIIGKYDCQYFEHGGATPYRQCELEITNDIGTNAFIFKWTNGANTLFTGRGYRMNKRQIAVHYW